MNELKLYRVTAIHVICLKRRLPLDVTILATDRECAIRGACNDAGYSSVTRAAQAAGMDYFELIKIAQVTVIQETTHAVPSPFTEASVDNALMEIAKAVETLPNNVARAVETWLAGERLKRRHGELPDSLDVSWIPGLVKAFEDHQTIVID